MWPSFRICKVVDASNVIACHCYCQKVDKIQNVTETAEKDTKVEKRPVADKYAAFKDDNQVSLFASAFTNDVEQNKEVKECYMLSGTIPFPPLEYINSNNPPAGENKEAFMEQRQNRRALNTSSVA